MFQPIGHCVLIKVDKQSTTTPGGLTIPSETQERMQFNKVKGILIAMGEEAWDLYDAPLVDIGDRVIFIRHAGTFLDDYDKENSTDYYRIVNDTDVLMKEPKTETEPVKNEV